MNMAKGARRYYCILLIICYIFIFTGCYQCADCIYPDRGVGPIRIGRSTIYDVLKKWPDPSDIIVNSTPAQYYIAYKNRGVVVFVREDLRVGCITLYSAGEHKVGFVTYKFKKFNGLYKNTIGLDSTKEEVEKFFGGPRVNEETDEFNRNYSGIYFHYRPDGTIEYIEIYIETGLS